MALILARASAGHFYDLWLRQAFSTYYHDTLSYYLVSFSLSNVEYVMARQLCVRPGGNVILSSVTGAFTESKFLKQKEVAGMEKQLQRPE